MDSQVTQALAVATTLAWAGIAAGLIIWLVVVPIGLSGIFAALGVPKSRAWIPFANLATVYRLGGFSEFWVIALVIPGASAVGAIVLFVASHNINRRLGKGAGYTVLAVLVWWVWALVLGLGRLAETNPSAGGGEPVVWSLTPRPEPSAAMPDDSASRSASRSWASSQQGPAAPVFTDASPQPSTTLIGRMSPPADAPARPPASSPPAAPAAAPASAQAAASAPVPPASAQPAAAPAETLRRSPQWITPPPSVAPAPAAAPASSPAPSPARSADAAPPASSVPPAAPASSPSPTRSADAAPPASSVPPAVPAATPSAPPPAPAVQPTQQYQHLPAPPRPATAPGSATPPAQPASTEAPDDATVISKNRFTPDPDATVVSARRRTRFRVESDLGARVELTGSAVIVGRRPVQHPLYPHAQLVTMTDAQRSVSASHAVLEQIDGEWMITDLGSTNGVWLVDPDTGAETELGAHNRAPMTPEVLLGELRIKVVPVG
ncbi:DUF5684 domain-containing protein [Gryllotalpicola ginsengisoli]|uniref:DUF5684 domain-containing protein n=1 Tax=Gryllotalpicola ginsengisoli TaxID=444608 RepID=UPI0003B55DD8|nr:DUF5684 domain-containing protein [Gryllotalpicola ginsengisoli]